MARSPLQSNRSQGLDASSPADEAVVPRASSVRGRRHPDQRALAPHRLTLASARPPAAPKPARHPRAALPRLSFIPAESASFDARLLRVSRSFHAALGPRFYRVLVLTRSQTSCERFVAGYRADDILARRETIERLEIDIGCFDPREWSLQALGLPDDDDDIDDVPTPLAHLREQLSRHLRLWRSVTTMRFISCGGSDLETDDDEYHMLSDLASILALGASSLSHLILGGSSGRFRPLPVSVLIAEFKMMVSVLYAQTTVVVPAPVLQLYRKELHAVPSRVALLQPLPPQADRRTGAPSERAEAWLELLLDAIDHGAPGAALGSWPFLDYATLDLVPLVETVIGVNAPADLSAGVGNGTGDDDNGPSAQQLAGWALVQQLCADRANALRFATRLPEGLDLARFLPPCVGVLGLDPGVGRGQRHRGRRVVRARGRWSSFCSSAMTMQRSFLRPEA